VGVCNEVFNYQKIKKIKDTDYDTLHNGWHFNQSRAEISN